jgi:putative ABC transport system permease protein
MEKIKMFKINFHNLREYFKIAVKSLVTRKVRSWLTIIGIVIGVFLVVSLLSLSEGLKNAVMQQLGKMGKDLITVVPGDASNIMTSMQGGAKLTNEDLKLMEKTKGVGVVIPMNYSAVTARYKDEKKTVLIYGNDWKESLDIFKNDMGWSLSSGKWPISGKNEVLLGSIAATEIFPGIKINDYLVINGKKYTVVGILNSVGAKDDDSMVSVDLEIFRSLTGDRTGAKAAFLKIKTGYSPDEVVEYLKKSLEENRKRKIGQEADASSFTILTSEKLSDIVGNVMGMIQAVIIGFASIAIIVGGVGIMNTMYTSVRERTKEIGIMKAIGAKNRTITTIFLIESGIFGMLGGIGGTFLGMVFAKGIEIYFQIHPLFYLKADVGPVLILFSIGFSFIIGCVSGYFPARSASKLKPVDALRYE